MLDIITLVSENTNNSWVNQAVSSVNEAIKYSEVDCNYIISPGVPGNIRKARLQALKKSKADYIAWVDDDDYLLPNALTNTTKYLNEDYTAIFAREMRLFNNGLFKPNYRRHHFSIYRRDVVEKALNNNLFWTEFVRYAEQPVMDLYEWVYIYRIYGSPGSVVRGKDNYKRGLKS